MQIYLLIIQLAKGDISWLIDYVTHQPGWNTNMIYFFIAKWSLQGKL